MKGNALTDRLEVYSTRVGRAKSPDPGRLMAWLLAVILCLGTGIASAAEVVDLRVGKHADFTRVVFELDRPAGYRLAREKNESGVTEVVVTLNAESQAKSITISKAQISSVELVPQNEVSVARIALKGDGLRIKEMILLSPPRIVLDVVDPSHRVAAAPAPAEAAAPAAASPVVESQPVAKVASSAPAKSAPPTASKTLAAAKPPAARPAAAAKVPAPPPAAVPAAKPANALAARTPVPPQRQKPVAKPMAVPTTPAAIPQPEAPSLLNAKTLGGGLALLGLVGGGAFFVMRRRANADPVEMEGFDADPLAADNPFAELGDDFGGASESVSSDGEEMMPSFDQPAAGAVDEFAAAGDAGGATAKSLKSDGNQTDLFDTNAGTIGADENDMTNAPGADSADAGNAGDSMESFGDTTVVTEGMDAMAAPIANMGGDSSDTMQMMQAMERRMAALESRLDEVSEAKERLERQVAAQTEELRVQRAAIARTQRALRNLSRPEDEAPTEPALRQPDGGTEV